MYINDRFDCNLQPVSHQENKLNQVSSANSFYIKLHFCYVI